MKIKIFFDNEHGISDDEVQADYFINDDEESNMDLDDNENQEVEGQESQEVNDHERGRSEG